MNKKELEAFAKEAAKGIKTPEDLTEFSQMLKKITIEAALNAEMDEHLGFEKHQQSTSTNSRNGKSSKQVKTEDGEFKLDTPRDREGTFEPKLVKKHQTRFTSMDDKILWLYAQGMSTREIVNAFDEWYGAEISPTLVSRVTNAVLEQVIEWQSRPLDAVYPIDIQNKLDVLALADELGNVAEASRLSDVSRDTIYRHRKLIEQGGIEALQHQEPPNLHHKNRTDKAIEQIVIEFSLANPHLGQSQVSRRLKSERNIKTHASGVRNIWLREKMNTTALRLAKLAEEQ